MKLSGSHIEFVQYDLNKVTYWALYRKTIIINGFFIPQNLGKMVLHKFLLLLVLNLWLCRIWMAAILDLANMVALIRSSLTHNIINVFFIPMELLKNITICVCVIINSSLISTHKIGWRPYWICSIWPTDSHLESVLCGNCHHKWILYTWKPRKNGVT